MGLGPCKATLYVLARLEDSEKSLDKKAYHDYKENYMGLPVPWISTPLRATLYTFINVRLK